MNNRRIRKIIQKLHKKKALLNTDDFINYIIRQPRLRYLIINNLFKLNDIEKYKYNLALKKYNEELEEIMANDLYDQTSDLEELLNHEDQCDLFTFDNEFKNESLIFNNTIESDIINKEDLFAICHQLQKDFMEGLDINQTNSFDQYLDFYLNNYLYNYLIDYIFNLLEQALLFSNSEHNPNHYIYLSDFFEEPSYINYQNKDVKVKNYIIEHVLSFLNGLDRFFSIFDSKSKEAETYINAVALLITDFIGDAYFESTVNNHNYLLHDSVSNYDFLTQVYNENITNILRSDQLSNIFDNFIKDNNINQSISFIGSDYLSKYHIYTNFKNLKKQVKNHIQYGGGFILYDDVEDNVFYFIYDINDNTYKIIENHTIKNTRYDVLEKIFIDKLKKHHKT